MALKVFSPCIFSPDGIEADREQKVISGGTSLSGADDTIATDGGGRWFAQFSEPYLDEPVIAKTWRALSAHLSGARPIIVRLCDARHQPAGGFVEVPHSDGTPLSDDTLYVSGETDVRAATDAPLRATTLAVDVVSLPEDLTGGERFSIQHPTMLDRAYEISDIDVDAGTITFEPPLREAVSAGTPINFEDPRCVMRIDGAMSSPTRMGFAESPGVRFVEHFPGPGGY